MTCIVPKLIGGGGGGGGANRFCLLFCRSVHFDDFNSNFNTIQTRRQTEISPSDIDSSTLFILIILHRSMICECTIKENSFVSPYDVMLVLQYSLITSSVSIILAVFILKTSLTDELNRGEFKPVCPKLPFLVLSSLGDELKKVTVKLVWC